MTVSNNTAPSDPSPVEPGPALQAEQAGRDQIIVVGGGAGGLELAVRLARRLRRDQTCEVVLVDRNPTHVWKPLFHEVATGSLNRHHDEASYRMLARKHRFRFVLGAVSAVQTAEQTLVVDAVLDADGGMILPARALAYSQLVLCVGGQSNDFGIDGVRDHARQLDSLEQAETFNQQFAALLHRFNAGQHSEQAVSVAIVGGGATGVELAADMHNVARRLPEYGLDQLSTDRLQVAIIEAAPRLLPRLTERVSEAVTGELRQLGVQVHVGTAVSRVEPGAVLTKAEERIPADLTVWAAGVKAPAWLKASGLPVDQLGRVEVTEALTVQDTKNVFAIGDCCAFKLPDGSVAPARAQAAHQMAGTAAANLLRLRREEPLQPFRYRDFGSLISLSRFSTVGSLMGNLMQGTVFVEGWFARLAYLSLYRMHQAAIYGTVSMVLLMLGDRIYKATRAEVKLH